MLKGGGGRHDSIMIMLMREGEQERRNVSRKTTNCTQNIKLNDAKTRTRYDGMNDDDVQYAIASNVEWSAWPKKELNDK